jgi:exopolysaccharide production protein ExoQ
MKATTKLDLIVVGTSSVAISGAVMSFLFGEEKFDYVTGSSAYETALAICYGFAGILALVHLRQVVGVVRRSKPLLAMIALALASALWAENPSLAMRRSLALLGGTLIGVLMAARFTTPDRLKFLSFLLRSLAVGSLIFAIFLPRYGVTQGLLHAGDWVGLFSQKNGLGAYAALGLLVEVFCSGRVRTKICWSALYFLLLIKSGSASPLVTVIATLVLTSIFMRLRRRHKLSLRAIVLSVTAITLLCLMAGFGSGLVQAALGRSTDLSGRGELWRALIPTILMHPLLGYGYGAFWAGGSREYFDVARNIHWIPSFAHNGYLEIMVSLGIVGLILGCWFFAEGGFFSTRIADFRESPEDLFPLALVVYSLIENVTEVTLLYHNNLEWAVLVATMLSVVPGSPDWMRIARFEQVDPPPLAVEEYA